MPYQLSAKRKKCSPGTKRTSKKGSRPIVCMGTIKKRKGSTSRKKKGCSYGRNPKSKKCYSKKAFHSKMRKLRKKSKSKASSVSRVAKKIKAMARGPLVYEL